MGKGYTRLQCDKKFHLNRVHLISETRVMPAVRTDGNATNREITQTTIKKTASKASKSLRPTRPYFAGYLVFSLFPRFARDLRIGRQTEEFSKGDD